MVSVAPSVTLATAGRQATSVVTGTPVAQLAAVVHNPSPAAPVQVSVQAGSARGCSAGRAAGRDTVVAGVAEVAAGAGAGVW